MSFSQILSSLKSQISPLSSQILTTYKFPPHHFIEIFIYFDGFLEDEHIDRESFITSNSNLIMKNDEEENEINSISSQIFEKMSRTNSCPLYALIAYIQTITITAEINEDILYNILDKDKKGYVDYNDLDILISNFEEFCGENKNWDDLRDSFEGKKITKRNLTQCDFSNEIFDLFKKSQDIINPRLEASLKNIQSKDIDANLAQTSPIYFNPFINNSNLTKKTIYELIFDENKANEVRRIKFSSLLYDIELKDFIAEFSKHQAEHLDIEKFIQAVSSIINKKTSNLNSNNIQKAALSKLFQLIDSDHKNKITYYQGLGGIFILAKATNEEKIEFLLSFQKKIVLELLFGLFGLYINKAVVGDFKFFSQLVYDVLNEIDCLKPAVFQNFLKSTNDDFYSKLTSRSENELNESHLTSATHQWNVIQEGLTDRFTQMKNGFSPEIQSLSITDVTLKLIKNSTIGRINNLQLSNFLDSIVGERFGTGNSKQKAKVISNFMDAIKKYFDFSQNELIDIRQLHSFLILIVSGTNIEKIQSIFIINDVGVNDPINKEELRVYLIHLFGYSLKEMKVDVPIKEVVDELLNAVAKGKKKISLLDLVRFYESILHE